MKKNKTKMILGGLLVVMLASGISGFIIYKNHNQIDYSKYQPQKLETLKYQKQWDKESEKYPDNSDFEIKGTKIIKYKGDYSKPLHIVIPDYITEIGKGAFTVEEPENYLYCKQSYLSIPSKVKIDHSAFNLSGPLSIKLEEGRTEITRGAFNDLYLEITIIFPSTIKTIESYGITCSDIADYPTEIYLNEGLETVKYKGLVDVSCQLPTTLKTLEDFAISTINSQSVKQVDDIYAVLPNGLESIGIAALTFDIVEKKTYIPASVKEIDRAPIIGSDEYYDNGYGYYVNPKNKYYKSDKKGWLYSKDGKTLIYSAGQKTIRIPEGVETILECSIEADGGCIEDGDENTQHIYFPKSVKNFNVWCTLYANKFHFAGSAPKVITDSEESTSIQTYYIPKGHLEEYKKAFAQSLDNCKFIEE